MKKVTVTIATDKPDARGDILKLDGVRFKNPVQLTKDFKEPVGEAEVSISGNEIKAAFEVPNGMEHAYPAIGFQVLKSHEENGVRHLDEIKLHYVGLSFSPNVDPDIKTIKDQTSSND